MVTTTTTTTSTTLVGAVVEQSNIDDDDDNDDGSVALVVVVVVAMVVDERSKREARERGWKKGGWKVEEWGGRMRDGWLRWCCGVSRGWSKRRGAGGRLEGRGGRARRWKRVAWVVGWWCIARTPRGEVTWLVPPAYHWSLPGETSDTLCPPSIVPCTLPASLPAHPRAGDAAETRRRDPSRSNGSTLRLSSPLSVILRFVLPSFLVASR